MAKEKSLAEKIKKRMDSVIKIIKFIESFVGENGKTIKYSQGSCNTHIIKEFKDFAGFDIHYSSGETMFGGETFAIKFNSEKVFSFHYQSSPEEDGKIEIFFPEDLEQNFLAAMRRKNSILKELAEKQKRKEEASKKKELAEKRKMELLETAKRLKLA